MQRLRSPLILFKRSNKTLIPKNSVSHSTVKSIDTFEHVFSAKNRELFRDLSKEGLSGKAKFMRQTFFHTGVGIGTSCLIASLIPVSVGFGALLTGFGIGLGATIYIGTTKRKEFPIFEELNGTVSPYYPKDEAQNRTIAYYALTSGMGLSLGGFFQQIALISPWIFPLSFLATSVIFYGCYRFATNIKNGEMINSWKTPLLYGIMSLLLIQVIGLIAMAFTGPLGAIASMCHSIDMLGGVALFTGFAIYDLHKIERAWLKGRPDHINISANLFLDFINLLIRIMEIMAKSQAKK